jgi:putative transposase
MPTQRIRKRIDAPNHIRFITFSCYRRLPLFQNDLIKDAFRDHLNETRYKLGFHLHAWVIMPEHIHLLVWPDLDRGDITKINWHLKRPFAKRVINRWKELDASILNQITTPAGSHRFWQQGGGYDRNIFSNEELQEKINYIHTNPVARGLVKHPAEYPWSSMNWYEGDRDHTIQIDPIRKPTQ